MLSFKIPQNTEKIHWTKHSISKMKQYSLSESRVKRVLRFPERIEEGIAPGTIAMMQKAGSKKRPYEIWVMFAILSSKSNSKVQNKRKKVIISCWKYPGISPKGKEIPIPEELKEEIQIELKKLKL